MNATIRKSHKIQPIGTELSSFQLNSLFEVYNVKSIVQILVGFLLVVQFMMQIKFNLNNFILYGVSAAAWQRASGIYGRERKGEGEDFPPFL